MILFVAVVCDCIGAFSFGDSSYNIFNVGSSSESYGPSVPLLSNSFGGDFFVDELLGEDWLYLSKGLLSLKFILFKRFGLLSGEVYRYF